MLKVEVGSRETIKPSSPTPPHQRTHCLSWLDQLAPPSHVPLILFYPHPTPAAVADSLLPILKQSLSHTLTLFPPLAGRLNPSSPLVDCNDAGAYFSESRVHSPLAQLVRQHPQPDVDALGHLLPCDASCSAWSGPLLCVQVNVFSCGGVAIGVCAAHRIADGLSLATFVSAWAAAARGGGGDVPRPNLDAASLFPPAVTVSLPPSPIDPTSTKKLVTKRFAFDASKLALLRKPTAGEGSRPPTRVEAVTALIWRCAMRARAAPRVSVAIVVVNLRGRTSPPLPESSFGNLCTFAAASDVEAGDDGAKQRLEEKLRIGIEKISRDRVQRLQGADGPSLAFEASREAGLVYGKTDADMHDIDIYYFNSWFGFPVYESDFGWGKPAWVGTARFFWKNLVLLMGGRDGDGTMEAWVTLEEEEMVGFERDHELCSFVSSAPINGEA